MTEHLTRAEIDPSDALCRLPARTVCHFGGGRTQERDRPGGARGWLAPRGARTRAEHEEFGLTRRRSAFLPAGMLRASAWTCCGRMTVGLLRDPRARAPQADVHIRNHSGQGAWSVSSPTAVAWVSPCAVVLSSSRCPGGGTPATVELDGRGTQQQLERALLGVLARDTGVARGRELPPRAGAQHAPQQQDAALAVRVLGLGCRRRLLRPRRGGASARPRYAGASAARSSAPRTSPVSGLA